MYNKYFIVTKQPTPRKGTETTAQCPELGSYAETTHTPQGDGNSCTSPILHPLPGNNPHPARGRKLVFVFCWATPILETTHTPQGDGNSGYWQASHRLSQKQPTPRKGTETRMAAIISRSEGNNPHPARGRKPSHFALQTLHPRNNPHPARGRKLFHLPFMFALPRKQPTPRKGTETACQYL